MEIMLAPHTLPTLARPRRRRPNLIPHPTAANDEEEAAAMVLIPLVCDYIDRMLHDILGMKVLILNPQTVGMVSVVYSQSDLLRKEVFLVETIDNASSSRESMVHLKTVLFLRASSDNVQKLCHHLATP